MGFYVVDANAAINSATFVALDGKHAHVSTMEAEASQRETVLVFTGKEARMSMTLLLLRPHSGITMI